MLEIVQQIKSANIDIEFIVVDDTVQVIFTYTTSVILSNNTNTLNVQIKFMFIILSCQPFVIYYAVNMTSLCCVIRSKKKA